MILILADEDADVLDAAAVGVGPAAVGCVLVELQECILVVAPKSPKAKPATWWL